MRFPASYIWAATIATLVIVWMFSDNLINIFVGDQNSIIQNNELNEKNNNSDNSSFVVSAIEVKNESVPVYFRANGITKSIFDIQITARRGGLIKNIYFKDGSSVNEGDIIMSLDQQTLQQELNAAKALLKAEENRLEFLKVRFQKDGSHSKRIDSAKAELSKSKKDFESSKELKDKGFTTELEFAKKYAGYKSAEASLTELLEISKDLEISRSTANIQKIYSDIAKIKQQIKFTEIKAPRSGRIENIQVDVGEYIDIGENVVHLIGLDELIVEMQIPQSSISAIKIGDLVEIKFGDKKYYSGRVQKIGAVANDATRTFNIEVQIENSDIELRAGMTAEAQIKINQVEAFKISPAHLTTDNNGNLYVKVIGANKKVENKAIKIVKTNDNFAYISGLVDKTIVLTTGQAFLKEGDKPIFKTSKDESR